MRPTWPLAGSFLLAVLLPAVAGGLLRAGVALPLPLPGELQAAAVSGHAMLMLCAFFGSVIAAERAVALRLAWAWLAPLAAASGGVLQLAGWGTAGAALQCVAATCFVGLHVVLLRRQCAPHTLLLALSAVAWWIGCALHLAARGSGAVLPWWLAFPVLTVVAERLEMTRLMPARRWALPALCAAVALLVAGAAWAAFDAAAGAAAYGLALMSLAAWLLVHDVARRTVRVPGLPRYMAVCLLSGHAWLGVGGLAWLGMALGCPGRDLALHAVGLGFLVNMVMGHAPVIVPAVLRVRLRHGPVFYAPWLLLQGSLLLRVSGGAAHPGWRAAGALGNAAALLLFVATMAWAARTARAPVAHGPVAR